MDTQSLIGRGRNYAEILRNAKRFEVYTQMGEVLEIIKVADLVALDMAATLDQLVAEVEGWQGRRFAVAAEGVVDNPFAVPEGDEDAGLSS